MTAWYIRYWSGGEPAHSQDGRRSHWHVCSKRNTRQTSAATGWSPPNALAACHDRGVMTTSAGPRMKWLTYLADSRAEGDGLLRAAPLLAAVVVPRGGGGRGWTERLDGCSSRGLRMRGHARLSVCCAPQRGTARSYCVRMHGAILALFMRFCCAPNFDSPGVPIESWETEWKRYVVV